MKVQCFSNRISGLAEADWQHLKSNVHVDEVDLDVGRIYDVFGLAFREGHPWFYVLEDEDDVSSLRLHFSGFFKVIDPNIGSDWQYCPEGHSEYGVAILPAMWANSPGVYESLMDDGEDATELFERLYQNIASHR